MASRRPSQLPQPPRAVPAPAPDLQPAHQTTSASVSQVLASPGTPLPPAPQQEMQRRFGHDFSQIRVHADATAERSARAMNANAFTVGQHLAFAPGKYAPHTSEGKRLLAHELVHALQQQGAPAAPQGSLRVSAPNDSHEVEADRIARDIGRDAAIDVGAPVRVTATAVQVARDAPRDGYASAAQTKLNLVRDLLVLTGQQLTLIRLVNEPVCIEIKVPDGSSRLFRVVNPWIDIRDDRFGHPPTTTTVKDGNKWDMYYRGDGSGTPVNGRRIVFNFAQSPGDIALALYRDGEQRLWNDWDASSLTTSAQREDRAAARTDYVTKTIDDIAWRNAQVLDMKEQLNALGAGVTTPLLLENEYAAARARGIAENAVTGKEKHVRTAGMVAGARVFKDALESGRLLTHTNEKYADYYGKQWDQKRAALDKEREKWVQEHPDEARKQAFDAGLVALAELVNRTNLDGKARDEDIDAVVQLVDSVVPLAGGAQLDIFMGRANEGLERLLGPFGFRTVFGTMVAGLQRDRLEYALGNFANMKPAERAGLRRDPFGSMRRGIQTWATEAELQAEGRLVAIRKLPDGSLHVGPLSEFREAEQQNRINHALGQLEMIRNSGPASLVGRIVGGEKGAAIGAMVDAGLMIRQAAKARQAVRTQMSNMGSGGHEVTRQPLERLPIVERAQPRTPVPKPDLPTEAVKKPLATTSPPVKVATPPPGTTPPPPKPEVVRTETLSNKAPPQQTTVAKPAQDPTVAKPAQDPPSANKDTAAQVRQWLADATEGLTQPGSTPLDPAAFAPPKPQPRVLPPDFDEKARARYPQYVKDRQAKGQSYIKNIDKYVQVRRQFASLQPGTPPPPPTGEGGKMHPATERGSLLGVAAEGVQSLLRNTEKNNQGYEVRFIDPERGIAIIKNVIPDFMPTTRKTSAGQYESARNAGEALLVADSKMTWDKFDTVKLDSRNQMRAMMVFAARHKLPFVVLVGEGRDVAESVRRFAKSAGTELHVVQDTSGQLK